MIRVHSSWLLSSLRSATIGRCADTEAGVMTSLAICLSRVHFHCCLFLQGSGALCPAESGVACCWLPLQPRFDSDDVWSAPERLGFTLTFRYWYFSLRYFVYLDLRFLEVLAILFGGLTVPSCLFSQVLLQLGRFSWRMMLQGLPLFSCSASASPGKRPVLLT